jgi:hypothetical protein
LSLELVNLLENYMVLIDGPRNMHIIDNPMPPSTAGNGPGGPAGPSGPGLDPTVLAGQDDNRRSLTPLVPEAPQTPLVYNESLHDRATSTNNSHDVPVHSVKREGHRFTMWTDHIRFNILNVTDRNVVQSLDVTDNVTFEEIRSVTGALKDSHFVKYPSKFVANPKFTEILASHNIPNTANRIVTMLNKMKDAN